MQIQHTRTRQLTDAEAAYMQRRQEIVEHVKKLGVLLDNHLQPGEHIDWGHVGDLGRIEGALAELLLDE